MLLLKIKDLFTKFMDIFKRKWYYNYLSSIDDGSLFSQILLVNLESCTNGEMKKALHDYEEVNKEMLDFLIENSDRGE